MKLNKVTEFRKLYYDKDEIKSNRTAKIIYLIKIIYKYIYKRTIIFPKILQSKKVNLKHYKYKK